MISHAVRQKGYKMESKNLKLSPPWVTAYNEICALFKEDPDVRVLSGSDDGGEYIELLVDGADKADALQRLLPKEYMFGNAVVRVEVVPSNKAVSGVDIVRKAFAGNPILKEIKTAQRGIYGAFSYALFRKEVVQFFNDEMGDPSGNRSTLFADIANERLVHPDGVFFSTSAE